MKKRKRNWNWESKVNLMLRVPVKMANELKERAQREERSVNNFIVHYLQKSIELDITVVEFRSYSWGNAL